MQLRRRAAALCVALAVAVIAAGTGVKAAGQSRQGDLEKRVAALEAQQKEILKQLQEIRAALSQRPQQPPTPIIAPPPEIDVDVAGSPARGRTDARVTLIEFSDYQCSFCGRFHRETFSQIDRDYVNTGKVRYVFKNFPIERIHPLAKRAADAALCAGAQGKFWQMHDRLFGNQQALGENDLSNHAQAVGLNMVAFRQCFYTAQPGDPIRRDQMDGQRAKLTGTPTFLLGTTGRDGKVHVVNRISGAQPYQAFKNAIDALLKGK